MTNLNQEIKNIFDEVTEIKYGMTFAEAEADVEASKKDEFNEGFDDAYDLNPCEPQSDIPEYRNAYSQGYAEGVEAWVKGEYPNY